jgi:hypothetical protein
MPSKANTLVHYDMEKNDLFWDLPNGDPGIEPLILFDDLFGEAHRQRRPSSVHELFSFNQHQIFVTVFGFQRW